MNPFSVSQAEFETFFLMVVRISTMLFVFPVFSARQIPRLLRVAIAFLFAFVLSHTVQPMAPLNDMGSLVAAVISQVTIGIVIGFVAYLVFMGIQFAGEILDLQIGFAVANVINPATQEQVTIVGEFQLTIATLIFLVSDSHLIMLQGLGNSFHLLPLPYVSLNGVVVTHVMQFVQDAFFIVVQIAAPPAVALFLTNVSLGLMARVAPQMNVFVIGFPLQIGVGLLMLGIGLPLLGYVEPELFNGAARHMDDVMRALRPG